MEDNSNEDFLRDIDCCEEGNIKERVKKKWEKEKKQSKWRSEEELKELFPDYPNSNEECIKCKRINCPCGYKFAFEVEDKEGYKRALEKYGVVIIKNVITEEECEKSVKEFMEEMNETATKMHNKQTDKLNRYEPWTWENHNWPSRGKFLASNPAFTPQAFKNRTNPNIYKVFSSIFNSPELFCSIDNWGLFRPTKDLRESKEKFLQVSERKLRKFQNFLRFCQEKSEMVTSSPPIFDFEQFNFRFFRCSEDCVNSPLDFFERLRSLLAQFDLTPLSSHSPPIYLDPLDHSAFYNDIDNNINNDNNDNNNNNNNNNVDIQRDEVNINNNNNNDHRKCKGRCNWVIADRVDWRHNLKPHWDLNPWKYNVEKRKGEVDLYQGIVALDDCPEEVGGFSCVPSSHLFIPQWCEENEAPHMKRLTTRVPETDQMLTRLQKFPLRKGELVIWNSAIVHCNFPNFSSNFRFIQFIRMLPTDQVCVFKDRYSAPRILHQYPEIRQHLEDLRDHDRDSSDLNDLSYALLGLRSW